MIKKTTAALLFILLLTCSVSSAGKTVIVGGNIIGLKLHTDGVSIVEFTEKAPQQAGLKRGDVLQKIDGKTVQSVQEVSQIVENSDGKPLKLTVLRNGKEKTVTLAPTQTADGKKLGILVRDEMTGVGTVTYYDPEQGTFGALGHGVSDGETLLPLESGDVLTSHVASVTKGVSGDPGCLQGMVCGREKSGEILKNTPQGIFGTIRVPIGPQIEVADASEVHTGQAQIISNVRGSDVCYYDVKILALYPNEKNDRNLLIEVTDPDLLTQTGGIVQGMSGSPIIQDGKLVGAVTHVLIDEPTQGYGIFIEKMMNAA